MIKRKESIKSLRHVPNPWKCVDAAGDWQSAHRIAQEELTPEGSLVHAYLHRKEGDLANASYWYSNAGRPMPDSGLDEEWEQIARELTGKG